MIREYKEGLFRYTATKAISNTHTHKAQGARPVAAIRMVTPTQTGQDACTLGRHSGSVQANPPGGGTGALRGLHMPHG